MKKIILPTLVGMLVGAVAGAIILGTSQWFNEKWQVDVAEIEKWVSIAAFTGALMGAIAGAFTGLIIGFAKARRVPWLNGLAKAQ